MIRSFNLPDHEIEEGPLDGGMAHVYIARHKVLGRRVAIKVIRPEFVADSGFSARFVREAKIVSRLHHPNVVTLYQVGEREGKPYYVMEYLAGGELKDRIHSSAAVGKTGQQYGALYACELTLAEVLRIAKDVTAALAVAHHEGYVHRDIKPSNIMFRSDNSVVVTDFGIAKAIEPDKTQTDMTVTHGAVIGTPLYMSPEQVDCTQLGVTQVDGRADLYSLGAVLYYALTGHPPFTADSPFQLGLKHLSAAVPKLPPYLKHYQPLIQRCMAKRPADRFASAEALAAEIDRLRALHPRSAIPLDEPLPRFELPWAQDDGVTSKFFHSVTDWLSPTRIGVLVLVIALSAALVVWLATRTQTEDLLSVVELQQQAIDTLLAAPVVDFDRAFEKIEYTENLLKIQPNNPRSIAQLAQLQKKLEAGLYEEIANNQFESAKRHIAATSQYYSNWDAKFDLESALADAEKTLALQQEQQRQQTLRKNILEKIDTALDQRAFSEFAALLEQARTVGVSGDEIALRQTRLEQIQTAEKAEAEQRKQAQIMTLLQQFSAARTAQDLTAVDSVLKALQEVDASEEQLQQVQNERQLLVAELAEKAKAQLREKEQARFAQLEEQQASGALELQYSVWQSLNNQSFQTVPATSVQALKSRAEQRVTQLIRAEVKSGHYDVADIWSNDARARGMNLPWQQFARPAPKVASPADTRPSTPVQSEVDAAAASRPVSERAPAALPAAKPETSQQAIPVSPPVAETTPVSPAPVATPESKPKPRSQPREVQVIGF